MNKFLKARLWNTAYLISLAALLVNLVLFQAVSFMPGKPEGFWFFLFCLHYACAAVMFFTQLVFRKEPYHQSKVTITLLVLLISAFALNRVVPVFSESVPWLTISLFITSLSMLLFHYWNALPAWARQVLAFIMGVATMLFLYFALYLLPIYPVCAVGLIALGITIHAFTPFFLLIQTYYILRKTAFQQRAGTRYYLAGIAASLLVVGVYAVLYSAEVKRINHIYNRTSAEGSGSLPTWIEAMQRSTGGFMEDKVLKTRVAYMGFDEKSFEEFLPAGFSLNPGSEKRCHDPLIGIASFFAPRLQTSKDDRIKILGSLYNRRHDALERFWTGKDLYTDYVNTRVKIWPKLHLSYTEKMVTVINRHHRRGEAIYTFHLPEGGVVTSLSLWINGKEEKAILTTKEKADTAYRTVVGRERRDPSLVQWQEGNTVSVRVFPVEGGDHRKFRIGFTAPLALHENKQLRYDNVSFEGPSAANATEDLTLQIEGQPEDARTRSYKETWHVLLRNEPIQPNHFSFNGNTYTLQAQPPEREAVRTDKIYLDVNEAWSEKEVDEVFALAGRIPVYVWLRDEMMPVTKDNKRACMNYLRKQRFSMFPIHWMSDPAHALLITKNTQDSPTLADIQGSEFRNKLSAYLAKPDLPKIRLLNIGDDLSPYLKSLKEFRVFRYEKGGIFLLKLLLDNNTFAKDAETENRIVVDQAGIAITRQPADSANTPANNAPDHLLRLFAYNHIMQQSGKGLITGSAGQDSLVAAAKEAYVVSPLSSLIVLETQYDYNRFDIKDNGNSLKNASMKSTGAVPEPHEWALIILVLLTLLYTRFRNVLWSSAKV